jgi:cytochrome bd-type quinol oxidase subunit 1
MADFLFARSQMPMPLEFHIILAAVGIGLPLLMAIATGRRRPLLTSTNA